MIDAYLIGYGYWGKILARNIKNCPLLNFKGIVEKDEDKLKKGAKEYNVKGYYSHQDLPLSNLNSLAIIATPTNEHFPVAEELLDKDYHLLIEKPITLNSLQARTLLKKQSIQAIFVDHTFLYTSAVQKIKEIIQSKELGEIVYYDSTRANLGLFQDDIDVIWDLAPHDFSIMCYLLEGFKPLELFASGVDSFQRGQVNKASIIVNYENNINASINLSWLSPLKIRQTIISGTKKMLVWDDTEIDQKIKIYDTGADFKSIDKKKNSIFYRTGDISIPTLNNQEALLVELTDVATRILNKTYYDSKNSILKGIEVLNLLEKCSLSLKTKTFVEV